jgi:hypothetical protein
MFIVAFELQGHWTHRACTFLRAPQNYMRQCERKCSLLAKVRFYDDDDDDDDDDDHHHANGMIRL